MSDIFVKREKSPESEQVFNVGTTLGRKPTKGDIGIEVEVEGKKLPKAEDTPMPWVFHVDHSLRGQDNGEYVLSKPITFDEVPKAIDTLWAAFGKKGSTIDDSNRTSVHIHLNVQQFHLNRLTSFIAMYFAVEDLLTEWCGEHRVGNLFCLRGRDAQNILSNIRRFIKTNMEYQISSEHHYAALNANALFKFGSLEFRTLRGVSDPNTIVEWVGILRRLYELSAEYPDPREICHSFSESGPMAFFDNLLGPHAAVLRNGVSWSDDQIRDSIFDGIRNAQDLCYCRDWSVFQGVDLKADPFGRPAKKILKRMNNPPLQGFDVNMALAALGSEPPQGFVDDLADLDDLEELEFGAEGEIVDVNPSIQALQGAMASAPTPATWQNAWPDVDPFN